jgi:hypothetical protein
MKHWWDAPIGLHSGAFRPPCAVAVVIRAGMDGSRADTAATPDSKKSNANLRNRGR